MEDLGSYNPFTKNAVLDKGRVSHWIAVGAQPTASVQNLLVRKGILQSKKIAIKIRKRKEGEKGSAPQNAAVGAVPNAEEIKTAPSEDTKENTSATS